MNKKQGLLIVFEGIDGSGKTTQINLLARTLKEKNIDFEVISFPQYGQNEYAQKIFDYLSGKFGTLGKVDPYEMAKLYASDRKTVRDLIIKWIDQLEYNENGMPKEDLTILLSVDSKIGQKNSQEKNHPDIHEDNLSHLQKANEIFLELSKKEKNWVVVDCMSNFQ